MTIEITTSYGFCHNWTLKVYGKSFYLGQDVKFCTRVLGCEPSYIAQQIGSNDLSKETIKKKLAKFIIMSLELDRATIKQLEPWGLCAE
jgi:hypothetical protein